MTTYPTSNTRPRLDPAAGLRSWWARLQRGLGTLGGLAQLALWRLRYYSGLSLLALIGVVLAVGLVTSAAFFAQAVDKVMLDNELAEYSRITGRPPFAARVFTPSTPNAPLTLESAEAFGDHVGGILADEVGLPLREVTLMADSGVLRLMPLPDDTRYTGDKLEDVAFVYMTGVADHIEIEEGRPMDDTPAQDALWVWLHSDLAARLGTQIGDRYLLPMPGGDGQLPVTVAGFWLPTDPKSAYWFNNPNETMVEKLLVRRQDYLTWVEPRLEVKVRTATWQVILNEASAVPARARDYKAGFERAANVIPRYLPDARLTAPTLSLEKFVGHQTALTTLLLGFNVPALGFLLYFLILTSAVIAYWQRRETALLRSRGITHGSILNFTLLEACLLFLVGVPLGLLLGIGLARMMGYTESFLDFVSRPPLPVTLNGINLPLTVATLAVVLVAKLWTVAASARATVVTQAREHARPTRGPFWYRAYLDLILIIPTVYAYRQLVRQGWLGALVQDRPEDLYQDPLLVLVPGLFIICMALIAMRLFPLLMRLLDLLAAYQPWFPSYLALRQLGRQSHAYINPLLLVIVSLALGVYTLSLAASMDQWLADRVAYRVGADLAVTPYSASEAQSGESSVGAEWVPPVDEFRMLPGVADATRVGRYIAEINLPNGAVDASFMAIDRVDFPNVAYFRDDFARESLGSLMNRLALTPDGILVSQEFLTRNTLRIGDRLNLLVIPDYGLSVRDQFTVVGVYDYFPTVYPSEITVVGNLEYINSFFGITMPHRIWFRTAPGASGAEIAAAVSSTGVDAVERQDTQAILADEQAVMQRIGVFGTLSVSFLAAAVMAALGLLTYSYASLHERLFQFSILRAVGLHRREVISQVALEYAVLTAYGAIAGVLCGTLAARLFVPLFRTASGLETPLPPLIPIIAQDQILPLAAAFVGGMIVLEILIISSAFYNKLFEALRLGHHG